MNSFSLGVQPMDGIISFWDQEWPGFSFPALQPTITADNNLLYPAWVSMVPEAGLPGIDMPLRISYHFSSVLELQFTITLRSPGQYAIDLALINSGCQPVVLNQVAFLQSIADQRAPSLGVDPAMVQIMEQGNYWGKVSPLVEAESSASAAGGAEPNEAAKRHTRSSDLVWVAYDRNAQRALAVGFTSSERWLGCIEIQGTAETTFTGWRVGFDGGDTEIPPSQETLIPLESFCILGGSDPNQLLADYGRLAAEGWQGSFPSVPPVSWCSWYPYRLSLTEDHILANAAIAAKRLKPLGLSVMEADLGWEKDYLPNIFEENSFFPSGLGVVSEKLRQLGFSFGAWKAPYTISVYDPFVKDHPEWLIADENGSPMAYWEWYWEPYGQVFILDLTHPGAQGWLREKITGLYNKGVRYLKADFISCACHTPARRRYNPQIVAGGGVEMGRIGLQIVKDAMPDSLLLNCGGPEAPGSGSWPLLYSCNDTGNTGIISMQFQQENLISLACHLFKNRRWGILQPSCLCVGLPGTLEEARQRATAAYFAGGQVDISDDLTTLPEDRWHVLTATLPSAPASAEVVDLFEPTMGNTLLDFSDITNCKSNLQAAHQENPPASVWRLQIDSDWDSWEIIAFFNFDLNSTPDKPVIKRFLIPYARLGLDTTREYQAFEFWSGQDLGTLPGGRRNHDGYQHIGDYQELLLPSNPGELALAFFGPGVKLLRIQEKKDHPWVSGTTFHQSCGTELSAVRWNDELGKLSGKLRRPAGEHGKLVIYTASRQVISVLVNGSCHPWLAGANGSVVLPLTTLRDETVWEIHFK